MAAAFRWDRLDTHYWIDEAISVGIAGHPLTEIPDLLRLDGARPLWYLLLGVWIRAFGSSTVATHSFSLLIALLTVPMAYWARHSLFGDGPVGIRPSWPRAQVAGLSSRNPRRSHSSAKSSAARSAMPTPVVLSSTQP